ncbi:hypothetical protein P7K49_006627, partial [Saguinus oedipus]
QATGRGSGMYFCWGAGSRGLQPRRTEGSPGAELLQAASGERHALLLLTNSSVHSCGENSRGQLGRRGAPRGDLPGERRPQARGVGTPEQGTGCGARGAGAQVRDKSSPARFYLEKAA